MNKHFVETGAASVAETLGSFAAGLDDAAIPGEVRRRATYLILDATGIALAAGRQDFAERTLGALSDLGAGDHPVIGLDARLPLRDAVTMNGLLVHGLDYDDTHPRGVVHATASAFPTALGMASARGADGRAMLSAYILGVEVAARLGAVAKGGFHQMGFHPTGLVGAFSSALVAGRLTDLGAPALATAQGIALSLASGSLEFLQDGAWTKRLHPGWAGAAGITAATLAAHGFEGPKATYEGRFGLYASHLGPYLDAADLPLATEGLGENWEVMSVAVKPLPACHFTHGCADAAMALHHAHGISADEIARVTALVPAEVVQTVCEPERTKKAPQNGYDAQFSIPYVVARGLIHGRFGLADLESAAITDTETLRLAALVDYAVDPASTFPRAYSGELIVTTKDGRELRHREAVNRGAADRPLSEHDIEGKFFENAALAVPRDRAEAIRDLILELDAAPSASTVADALGGEG